MQNILLMNDLELQGHCGQVSGVMEDGVRKGDVQAERGLELGNEDDLSDCMYGAKVPSEIHPDGPQAE